MNKLLIFGHGYTTKNLTKIITDDFSEIFVTSREPEKINDKFVNHVIKYEDSGEFLISKKNDLTHILCSIPPDENGDPVYERFKNDIKDLCSLKWIGYLSATSVYGDHNGEFVDENSELKANTSRGLNRILAEKQWEEFCTNHNIILKIFRIAGIYGKGRNIYERIKKGDYKLILKDKQYFSRIHINDLTHCLKESLKRIDQFEIFNLADDAPSNIQDVVEYICKKMNIKLPNTINYEQLENEMTKNFFTDNKKVLNTKIKQKLNFKLKYPSYKEGYNQIINSNN